MVTERDPKTNRVSISDLTPPIRAKVNDHQRGLAAIPTEYVAIADIDDEPVSGVKTSPVSSNWASEAEEYLVVSKNLLLGLMNAICEEDFGWSDFDWDEVDVEDITEMVEDCLDEYVRKDILTEQTVLGRITSGNVVALTVAQLWGLLSNYAEMYKHENATATNIQAANDWHFLNGFTTGEVGGGWSFHAGKQLAITAYATSDAGAKTQVTSATHAMVNGDIVSISNTAHYDGVHIVEQVATNTFVITVAFGGDDGASVGEHGGHFISYTATASGKYLISYTLSLIPANPNDICEVTTFLNATQNIKGESQTKLGAVTDYQNVAGHSIKDITVNDIISIAIRNISGAGDFTIRDCNLTLVRIG